MIEHLHLPLSGKTAEHRRYRSGFKAEGNTKVALDARENTLTRADDLAAMHH
jgi:hypothetical protein